MSDSEKIRDLVERLGALEPAHPSFDELAGYVDGHLDAISREVVASHVEDCARCRREWNDLTAFAKQRRTGFSPSLGGLKPALRFVLPLAAAAAIALFLFLFLRPAAPPPRELHIPQAALALRSSTLALRGRTTPGGPEPLAPLGAIVINDRPVFRWNEIPNARYRVEVFDPSFRSVASSGEIDGTRWTPPAPLPRGGTYLWQVTALTPNGSVTAPRPPSPEARFIVLDDAHAAQLEQLARTEPRPSLALGVAYAEAGVLDAAERELRAVDNAEARRFLRVLEQTAR
jgi:hypothetical protein